MRIIFTSIAVSNPQDYIAKKMKCIVNLPVDSILAKSNLQALNKEGYNSEYSALSEDEKNALRTRQARGIKYINAEYPLLPGEYVEEDVYTYFRQPDSSECIPAIFRTTNMSSAYFLFPTQRWNGSEITDIEDASSNKLFSMPEQNLSDGIIGTLVLEIFKGIFSKAGGKIFDLVFPQNHFDVDYERIKDIVKQAIDSAHIADINGGLHTVVDYMKNPYLIYKRSGHPKEELQSMLNGITKDALRVFNTISQPEYKLNGLSVYMEAFPVMLGVYQELAILEKGDNDYLKSEIYTERVNKIPEVIKHIEEATTGIQEKRKNLIKTDHGTCSRISDAGQLEFYTYYRWDDTLTKEYGYYEGCDAEKYRNESLVSHKDYVAQKVRDDLKIDDVIKSLQQLYKQVHPQ